MFNDAFPVHRKGDIHVDIDKNGVGFPEYSNFSQNKKKLTMTLNIYLDFVMSVSSLIAEKWEARFWTTTRLYDLRTPSFLYFILIILFSIC